MKCPVVHVPPAHGLSVLGPVKKTCWEKSQTLILTTIKFESGASDFPPEGPKKGSL